MPFVGGAVDDERDGKGFVVVVGAEGIDEEEEEILQMGKDELTNERGVGRPSISEEECVLSTLVCDGFTNFNVGI
jgi:hypothetical protein